MSKRKPKDIAITLGPTEDAQGAHLLRVRDGKVTAGEIRPAREGEPITGELVRLRPLDASHRVCEVEVLHAPGDENLPANKLNPEPEISSSGPARVTNASYRKNWDTIFDAKRKRRSSKTDFTVN